MTPEDRDAIRAEASMRILAAMFTNFIPPPEPPRDITDEGAKVRERAFRVREMERAAWAVMQANALIAELTIHEEHDPKEPKTIEELVRQGIAAGGTILACTHGVPSYEPCEECDKADAADKSGKTASADPA